MEFMNMKCCRASASTPDIKVSGALLWHIKKLVIKSQYNLHFQIFYPLICSSLKITSI